MPSFTDSSGSNYFGRNSMFLHVVNLINVVIISVMCVYMIIISNASDVIRCHVISCDLQVIKGSDPIEIRTPPVVQVSLDVAVSLDDFFESDRFVEYLAFVLRIDISMIRVVDIVSEDTPLQQRKRRNLENSVNMTVTLEIGDPPQNGSAVSIPPVADEYNQYNNESVDVDGERDVSY